MALSRTALTWIGLFATLLLASLVLGSSALAIAAVVLLTFPMIGAMALPPREIRVERRTARTTNWVGGSITIERNVTVSKGIGPIFIHDDLPKEMLVIGGNNFRVFWKWTGEKTFDASYTLLGPKRGVYRIGKTSWRAEDPLRVRQDAHGEGADELAITVVPRLGINRIAEIRARAANISPNSDRASIGVESTDFIELRDYNHGDAVRSINWKASARRTASVGLIVNKYQLEGRRAVWMFIDGASYMGVGTSVSNPLEYAVEAAFGIAHYYLTQGFTLGAYVFNNRHAYLSPDSGNKQLYRLKQTLLEIQTSDRVEGLPAAITRCKYPIFQLRPEILIITRIDAHFANPTSEQAHLGTLTDGIRRLSASWGRGSSRRPIRLLSVDDQPFGRGPGGIGSSTPDLVKWETRPLVKQIERAGASVIRWDRSEQDLARLFLRNLYAEKVRR
jgi:uncharacterized protein (DUF58 family)